MCIRDRVYVEVAPTTHGEIQLADKQGNVIKPVWSTLPTHLGYHKVNNCLLYTSLHYTTVKTNMFNGVQHPAIALRHLDGSVETLRSFDYSDYKSRMD